MVFGKFDFDDFKLSFGSVKDFGNLMVYENFDRYYCREKSLITILFILGKPCNK